ncbi:MAG: glucosidase, partial [Solirubrobacteraceae bacterium]
KFLEHFAAIADALERGGLWDEDDGFYYDVLAGADGSRTPLKVPSIAGLIPLLPTVVLDGREIRRASALRKAFARLHDRHPDEGAANQLMRGGGASERMLLSAVGRERMLRLLAHAFDESEFLSIAGVSASVDYEPAESTTPLFGGNSNWRGPVWMPLNYLFVDALARLGEQVGDGIVAEYPTGSGEQMTLTAIAADLRRRLIALWLPGDDGRRPVFGGVERMQSDPRWRENLLFYEYFNGDDGAGLGASHQTGWTALVADLIVGRRMAADPGARSLYD